MNKQSTKVNIQEVQALLKNLKASNPSNHVGNQIKANASIAAQGSSNTMIPSLTSMVTGGHTYARSTSRPKEHGLSKASHLSALLGKPASFAQPGSTRATNNSASDIMPTSQQMVKMMNFHPKPH